MPRSAHSITEVHTMECTSANDLETIVERDYVSRRCQRVCVMSRSRPQLHTRLDITPFAEVSSLIPFEGKDLDRKACYHHRTALSGHCCNPHAPAPRRKIINPSLCALALGVISSLLCRDRWWVLKGHPIPNSMDWLAAFQKDDCTRAT